MTLDELAAKCKGSLHLVINEHRAIYQTLSEYLSDQEREVPPEILQRMVAADCCYELQFYPNTPIGFYLVYGTSLSEVLEQATLELREN